LHTVNDWNKCSRTSVSVGALVFFMLAIATLQVLSMLISETQQIVYAQTRTTFTDNNIVRDLAWTSASLDNSLRPTTSNVITMVAASISDNGNNNSASPFLLPLPSSSQASDNNSGPAPAGQVSSTS